MIYILDPGEGHDVRIFEDRDKAILDLTVGARLFAVHRRQWREYQCGMWVYIIPSFVPQKMLDIG